MPAYQYEPLFSPDSIRLLLLQPSDARDAELKGSLLNTTLKECDYDLIDRYTALSYVWGSSEKPCQILLDDKAFAITRSLNDALRDMRDATRLRRIWADAICINQEDIPERNRQVRIMRYVYSTAHSTVIYLGHLTKELEAIFDAGSLCEQYGPDQTFPDVALQDVELARVDILARPWFTRVWVLQEFVFSKDPWVQCSTKRMRWANLYSVLHSPFLEPDPSRMGSVMLEMHHFREATPGRSRFQSILHSRRGYGAQDPRDLVFANISVSRDKYIADTLKVDYNDSLLQVFTKAALCINFNWIESSSEIIGEVDDVPAEKRVPGLPSWAPDWRLPPASRRSLTFLRETFLGQEMKEMSWNSQLGSRGFTGTLHAFTGGNLPPVLGHIGTKIGIIDSISGVVPKKGSQQNPSPVLDDFQQMYAKLAEMSRDTKAFEEQQHHCDVKHEKCCDVLNDSWSRWFQNLHETPKLEGSGCKDFLSHFCQWVLNQSTKLPEFWLENGGPDSKLWSIMFQCLRLYCGLDYAEPGSFQGEEFEGRRLAFTQDGKCGLVPSQARKGDMVGFLAQGDLPAIFRPKKTRTRRDSEIGQAIVRALRQGELAQFFAEEFQENTLDFSRNILWEFPTEGSVDVEHYSIIGECFFEDWFMLQEAYSPKFENLRVFALH